MEPSDASSQFDAAAAKHGDSHIEWLQAGEAMKQEIAALTAANEKLKSQVLIIGLGGTIGKTTTAVFTEAVQAYVSDKLIQCLKESNTGEIVTICETFPEPSDFLLPVFVRSAHDAARHAATILDYNGRSLDSHNPWHLFKPYNVHLREIDEPGIVIDVAPKPARKKKKAAEAVKPNAEGKPAHSVWFGICNDAAALHPASLPSTITSSSHQAPPGAANDDSHNAHPGSKHKAAPHVVINGKYPCTHLGSSQPAHSIMAKKALGLHQEERAAAPAFHSLEDCIVTALLDLPGKEEIGLWPNSMQRKTLHRDRTRPAVCAE